jgi:hypothetical protein
MLSQDLGAVLTVNQIRLAHHATTRIWFFIEDDAIA